MAKKKPEPPSMTDRVHSYADENEVTMLLCEPQDLYDEAVIGIADGFIGARVCYSKQKMIEALARSFAIIGKQNGEDPDEHDYTSEAIEFLEFNTFNAYVGDEGPIYIDDLSDRD